MDKPKRKGTSLVRIFIAVLVLLLGCITAVCVGNSPMFSKRTAIKQHLAAGRLSQAHEVLYEMEMAGEDVAELRAQWEQKTEEAKAGG